MTKHCGLGDTVGFLVIGAFVVLASLIAIGIVLVRASRRPRDERSARRVLVRGLAELAIGTWGLVIAAASEHELAAIALGALSVIGIIEHASARRALAALEDASELPRARASS